MLKVGGLGCACRLAEARAKRHLHGVIDQNALTSALADRYRIGRQLGAGGMATVFLARDLKHDRDVAIKVLKPELAQSITGERFLREIGITARLTISARLPIEE